MNHEDYAPPFVYHHLTTPGKQRRIAPKKSQIYPPLALCPTYPAVYYYIIPPFPLSHLQLTLHTHTHTHTHTRVHSLSMWRICNWTWTGHMDDE